MPFEKLKEYMKKIGESVPSIDDMEQMALPASPNQPKPESIGLPPIISDVGTIPNMVASVVPDTTMEIQSPDIDLGDGRKLKSQPIQIDPLAMGSMSKMAKTASRLSKTSKLLDDAARAKKLATIAPMMKETDLAKEFAKSSPEAQSLVKKGVLSKAEEPMKLKSGKEYLENRDRILAEKQAIRDANARELAELAGKSVDNVSLEEAYKKYDELSKKAMDAGRNPLLDPEADAAKQLYFKLKSAGEKTSASTQAKLDAFRRMKENK